MDIRHAIEVISRRNGQTVYIADGMLRTETLYRLEKGGDIEEGSPFKWRSISTAHDSLIDMRNVAPREEYAGQEAAGADVRSVILASGKTTYAAPDASERSGFRVISKQLESLIQFNREENAHLFILTVRRGLSPMTVCSDCETIVVCKNCSAPVVLHAHPASGGEISKNFFMCHLCGERRSADETCAFCGSWRLVPLGIGIDRVCEEIKKRFPGTDLFKMDADSARNEHQIRDILEKFRSKPGSILIGTELALQHLSDRMEHIAVASLDTLFSLPDFRIQERIMHTLIRLRAQAARTFLVQTRRPAEKVFEFGLKGNLSDFYKAAIRERKQFMYPPFFVLIKLTIEGKKDEIARSMAQIQKSLAPNEVDVFPAFTSTVRGRSVIHGLIRVAAHAWPDPELAAKLRALPPGVSVKIDPESLL
jgi:primosomal protein N'